MAAAQNAKAKATELAQFLNARVGGALSLCEESCSEWEGPSDSSSGMEYALASVQQRLANATMHVCVKVSASFQLKTKSKAKNNKQGSYD